MIILTPNMKYRLHIREIMDSDPLVVREAFVENVYRVEDSDFYASNIFIDIGANIGAMSLFVSSFNDEREVGNRIRTFAYEPVSANVEYLNKNIKENGKSREIKVIQKGVWYEDGKAMITDSGGSSSILENKRGKGAETEEIRLTSLDRVFSDNNISECDVMKIDVEGAEYQMIIKSSPETLRRIRYLTLEFDGGHEKEFGEMVEILAEYFGLTILGSPSKGGYIYARRY